MLKSFHLEKDWKLVSVLRCTKHHAVLSLKSVRNGTPEIVKIISRAKFDSYIYHELSRLSDRNLVPIKKIHSCGNWIIVHYPLLVPLRDYQHDNGLSLSEILELADSISKAVTALHEKKLLHLDISPDNIFLDDDGSFLLGDFSSIKRAGRQRTVTDITPCYTAPECREGKPSYASDQYSFAMLLFALLHNGKVYESGQKEISQFFSEQQKKMSALGIQYPALLYSYFERALSSNPSARYPDITSFVSDIQSCLEPLCGNSSYRMQLTDRSHSFYQVHTVEIPSTRNPAFVSDFLAKVTPTKKHIFTAAVLVSTLLLSGIVLSNRLNTFRKSNTETSYAEKKFYDTKDSISDTSDIDFPINSEESDNSAHILDISSKQADTIAELLDEDTVSQDCNILYGENNSFTSLEELTEFPHIQELYLSGNKIASLQALASLDELQILILSDNCCTDLSPLSSLSRLTVLDLSGNSALSQISCLRHLQNLRLLILTDTSIPLTSIRELQAAIPDCEIVYFTS